MDVFGDYICLEFMARWMLLEASMGSIVDVMALTMLH